jgi:hypothetical protein
MVIVYTYSSLASGRRRLLYVSSSALSFSGLLMRRVDKGATRVEGGQDQARESTVST